MKLKQRLTAFILSGLMALTLFTPGYAAETETESFSDETITEIASESSDDFDESAEDPDKTEPETISSDNSEISDLETDFEMIEELSDEEETKNDSAGSCGDLLTWQLDESGTLTISGTGEMTSHPWDNTLIKKLVIESGVTNICENAFYGCKNLTDVSIPGSVLSIGRRAFGSSGLVTISFEDGLQQIGYAAFGTCAKLESAILPNTVTELESSAFSGCSSLRVVSYPSKISNPSSAFTGCTSIDTLYLYDLSAYCSQKFNTENNDYSPLYTTAKEVTLYLNGEEITDLVIPDGITSIGDAAFRNCRIQSLTLPDSLTSVGKYAFSGLSVLSALYLSDLKFYCNMVDDAHPVLDQTTESISLYLNGEPVTDLVVPEGVNAIGPYAFRNCTLKSVVLSESVLSIAKYAFAGSLTIRSATIPKNVEVIDSTAFQSCSHLATIFYEGNKELWNNYNLSSDAINHAGIHYLNTEHQWSDQYAADQAASCTQEGIQSIHCTICGASKEGTEITVPALGHDYGEWFTVKNATCTEDGAEQRTCSRCSDTETRAIEATGHIKTITDGVAATCTDTGLTDGLKCSVCGTVLQKQEVIPATGHHYGDWVTTKAPTTSKTGLKYRICSTCGGKETAVMPKLKKQTMTGTSSYSKTYGTEDFTLNTKTNGDGDLTYSSSKTSVATVDETGTVHVVGVGTATITVKASGTETYAAASKSVTVKVSKAAQTVTTDESSYIRSYGDASFNLNAAASAGGKLTYKSSSTKVAAVSSDGTVTLKGAGTATITITAASTTNYNSATKKVTVKVSKVDQIITTGEDAYVLSGSDVTFNLNAVTSGNGKLTYKSSSTKVATVSTTGVVTIKGAGTATITVTAASTAGCNAASKKVTVTFSKLDQSVTVEKDAYKLSGSDAAFNLNAVTSGNGTLTYKSSKTSVATVSSKGVVTLTGAGTATITITAGSTVGYNASAPVTVTITVTKADQEIEGPDTISKAKGAKAFSLDCSAKTKLTYKSSNTKIATVSSTGKITIKGTGTVTITVTAASTSLYNGKTKTISIVIS